VLQGIVKTHQSNIQRAEIIVLVLCFFGAKCGGVLMGWFVTLWVQSLQQSHELYLKGQMLTGNRGDMLYQVY
jgi:hypothetical protein